MEREFVGQQYVAGFLFDAAKEFVVVVQKNRPDWQAGKLNAVGGHVEGNELWRDSMRREFFEETGLDVPNWNQFAQVSGPWGVVVFFKATGDVFATQAMEDEKIMVVPTKLFPYEIAIPNLSWLLPLAMYDHDEYYPVTAREVV